MKALNSFKRRVKRSGEGYKERVLNEGIRTFRKALLENPTCYEVQATVPDEVCITDSTRHIIAMITDVATNDQSALDDKFLHVDVEEDIDVGCYVKWQGINWLLVYEEVNGFPTHKTFIMKRCNQTFRFKQGDTIYEIPVSVTNLTLYSDGLADGKYISKADAKRNIKMGSNPVTRRIDLGNRIMLTGKTVFRITHIDNFSKEGLIACITLQTALVPLDDTENNIAYNPEWMEDTPKDTSVSALIEGEDYIHLGTKEKYCVGALNVTWELEDDICKVESIGNGVCIVTATKDSKFIGHTVTLYAKDGDSVVDLKDITIKGYF